MLLKELLIKNNIKQKDMANALNIDKEHMSKIANYKCLPTPEQSIKMCEMLNCNILDIYNKKEIDLILGTKKASRNQDSDLYYKLSVRLNKSSCNCLKREYLQQLGFKTLKDWVLSCIKDLNNKIKNKGVNDYE